MRFVEILPRPGLMREPTRISLIRHLTGPEKVKLRVQSNDIGGQTNKHQTPKEAKRQNQQTEQVDTATFST